ncbi:MAG: hypothetical protein KAF41_13455, partial [Flavobacterium sp.]|nr:hypothetical protein [Flavobacterium sp.]
MKKEREFLTELYSNHIEEIPFLLHFQRDKQLKSKLFVEYLQTETKPNFSLYLSSHFSKTELDNGFAEIQNNIPVSENKNTIAGFVPNTDFENKIYDLRNQFYDLVAKRELPEIYYSHSIVETKVVEKLKLVKQEIKDFEQFVFDATFYNPNDYATNFAKNIIKKLESTALPKLKNEILTNFINKQININLEIEFLFNEIAPRMLSEKAKISKEDAGRKYRELKMYADVYINEYLESNSKKENELLAKYKSIGFLDFKKVNTALSKIDTITEKLEYLKEIKEQYYDKYENLKTSLDEADYIYYVNNSETFWQVVFGNYSLYSPLSIQKPVYNKFFSNGLKTPEFTYWFLKYDAENVFNHTINSKIFKDKLNSDLKETFIKSELKQLEEQEQKAKDLLLNKELDIYNKHKNNYTYEKEVVLLRILDGNYYKENCSFKLGGWGTLEVQAYYKHILLKPYLEMQLKKTKSISTMEVIMSNKQNEIENNLTTFERINRELNIIAWAFECQSMEATTTMSYPMLHSKGRFLFNFYKITSNIEMLKLQDYIKHYTERFETTNNTSLVLNELKKIHEKARSILDYHNENLTESSKLAIDFYENIPTDFEESIKYKKEHTATIVTENLNPYHIVFEEEFHFDKQPKYNYLSSNNELSLFCQKLIDFTEKFEIIETVS